MLVGALTRRVVNDLVCVATALPVCVWGAWVELVRPRLAAFLNEAAAVKHARRR